MLHVIDIYRLDISHRITLYFLLHRNFTYRIYICSVQLCNFRMMLSSLVFSTITGERPWSDGENRMKVVVSDDPARFLAQNIRLVE